MTEVSFYVLATDSATARHNFACKLIEKIYRNDQFCFVLTDSRQQSEQIDDNLWTFRAGSFVPHEIFNASLPSFRRTVLIGDRDIPKEWQQIIINLSSGLPEEFFNSERILEILDNSETCIQTGRQRYREYQQAGLAITTHKISD